MSGMRFEGVRMAFDRPGGGTLPVLEPLGCKINDGEIVCFVGPSGCGKSTILNIVAGILPARGGTIAIGDEIVDATTRERPPGIGYAFQEPRLLDWLTVEDNLRFILKPTAVPKSEWDGRIDRLLGLVGLDGFRRRYPLELSGGMRSRVSLVRALIIEPRVLLMDEPLSGVDAFTAARIRSDFLALWREARPTVIFVTHDIAEAVYLADRVFLFTPRPAAVYREVPIAVERPRRLTDPQLLQYESEIRRIFFEEIFAGVPSARDGAAHKGERSYA